MCNLYITSAENKHWVFWEKSKGWMCWAAEHLTIMNGAETPPGILSVMRWLGWIVLRGIKILFVIEAQTSVRIAEVGETLVES